MVRTVVLRRFAVGNLQTPWYLSTRAVDEYAELAALGDTADRQVRNLTLTLLARLTREATYTRTRSGGLQVWAVTAPEGPLRLLVSTRARSEGDLPQLVSVVREDS